MKRKSDFRIGKRAYSEVCRMFPGKTWTWIAKQFGCDKKTIYAWRDGIAPSPMFLARFLQLGGDIEYILIGNRKRKELQPEFLAELEEEYN